MLVVTSTFWVGLVSGRGGSGEGRLNGTLLAGEEDELEYSNLGTDYIRLQSKFSLWSPGLALNWSVFEPEVASRVMALGGGCDFLGLRGRNRRYR